MIRSTGLPLWLVLPFFAAACSGGAGPSAPPPAEPARFAAVERWLDSASVTAGVSDYSFAVMRGDTVLFERSRGTIGPATAIPIASATKWLSGAVIMSLVDEGTLRLDDTVGRYLPAAPAATRQITVRHLFALTSGMVAQVPCMGAEVVTLVACAEIILAQPVRAAPGAEFFYGGASMHVAGHVAEVASGRDWAALLRTRLAEPLGMTGTGIRAVNPRIAGGAWSTRDDYLRFLRMLLADGMGEGRRVLAASSVREMERDQTAGARIAFTPHPYTRRYGIGVWRDRVAPDGRALQLSSQGAFGFSPWVDRERNIAAVLAVDDQLRDLYPFVDELQRRVRAAVDGR
jgi:serine-type D-Ala-D-Ala carboxypeptidase/endopeptidase